ncbi:hypothetical protein [Ornithinimicrobium avium]|uniref:hypothetical protein n=1 Tax=Ornithinimicrobium avium TaxID=2283195 RepID=UPI0013B4555E|nr:hypothetical protein [Ornithinimicrobium avium]
MLTAFPAPAHHRQTLDKPWIAGLKDTGLFASVASQGLPIQTAVAVGVTVRQPLRLPLVRG